VLVFASFLFVFFSAALVVGMLAFSSRDFYEAVHIGFCAIALCRTLWTL
jgi:hypothetical protein